MAHDYGRFVWFELLTTQVKEAQAFYGQVVGWTSDEMQMAGGVTYPLIVNGGAPVGGFVPPPRPDVPTHWVGYLSVEDVNATADKVVAHGGKVLMGAFDAPGVGRMQPVADPDGAALFLFHASDGDKPAGAGPGCFHWNELWAQDVQRAVAFYRDVFGFEVDSMAMPDGAYFILKNGDTMRAGVMQAPDVDAPARWQQYVQVDDCDAAVARAQAQGGTLVGPAMDVPGVGRFAHVADPVGGVMGLITPG